MHILRPVTVLGLGLLATSSVVRAELVYESEVPAQATQGAAAGLDDRETLRQALSSSDRAQTTIQVRPAPAEAVDADAATASGVELRHVSRTELMRRERVRSEIKNEDLLSQRLEELRLRDEKKRTDQLIAPVAAATEAPGQQAGIAAPTDASGAATAPVPPPALAEETVVAPVTEHPGQPAQVAASVPPVGESTTAVTVSAPEAGEKTFISITPRAGVANMNANDAFQISPHYSAGVALGVGVSDNVTFEVGYTYSEYGVSLNSTNPYVIGYETQLAYAGNQAAMESVAMKQNVADAGLKIHLLGPDAKLRPFIGGGAAYSKSYVNYDAQFLNYMKQAGVGSSDYDISSYLGYLSTGLDLRVNRKVSVGVMMKYYTVLTSREDQDLRFGAFGPSPYYGPYPPSPGVYGPYGVGSEADKQLVGSRMSESSFYSIMAGATFVF